MRELPGKGDIVGGDQHRGAELVDPLEEAHQQHRDLVVDIAGRLVGDQQIGAAHDRPGDGDALLLAAGKARGMDVELVLEPHPAQQFGNVLADFALRARRRCASGRATLSRTVRCSTSRKS